MTGICGAAYDADGALVGVYSAPDIYRLNANTPPGGSMYVVPAEAVLTFPIDLEKVRDFYRQRVDQSAGEVRTRYITDVPGQSQTYEKKEAEARGWQEGDTEDDYPFMAAEAAVRDVPIAQVRAEILAQVNALMPLAALIEAHRLNAKRAIAAAPDIPAIAAAAAIDWEAALS